MQKQLRINGTHRGVPVQGNRIRTALAENAKLAEKVKR